MLGGIFLVPTVPGVRGGQDLARTAVLGLRLVGARSPRCGRFGRACPGQSGDQRLRVATADGGAGANPLEDDPKVFGGDQASGASGFCVHFCAEDLDGVN